MSKLVLTPREQSRKESAFATLHYILRMDRQEAQAIMIAESVLRGEVNILQEALSSLRFRSCTCSGCIVRLLDEIDPFWEARSDKLEAEKP